MSSFLDPCNDTGSPSMSRTEDNLSNSEGPLLKRSLGKNNSAVSSENVCAGKSILSKNPSRLSCRDESGSSFDSSKKRYCLWALTLVLGIIGLCNLLLSITIIAVLRVSHGMEAMEVIPAEGLVKFYGRTDLDKVCVREGVCQGYGDEPVELIGDNSGVILSVKNRRHDVSRANFRVFRNITEFKLIESFEIKDSLTGDSIFSTNFPNFGLPSGVEKIAVNLTETHRIVSPVNASLSFESNREITIHGAESTKIESKTIVLMADNDVRVKSNRSIVVDGKKGIFIDTMRLPLAPVALPHQANDEAEFSQYKVCVCMPEGKIFRVPVIPGVNVRGNCVRVNKSPEHDPCQ